MLAFLLDEDTHGGLMNAFRRRTRLNIPPPIDILRVGDPDAPPLGTPDPAVRGWCEANGRILISNDRNTLARHFRDHLAAGRHLPGVLLIRPETGIGELIDEVALHAEAGRPEEYFDQLRFIPL